MKDSPLRSAVLTTVVIALVVAPMLVARRQLHQTKNFRVVQSGVLYRSGQMSLVGLKRIIHDYDIRTVVSLRDARSSEDVAPDADEEDYCTNLGLGYVRIAPRPWEGPSGRPAPVQAGVDRFLEVMRNPANHPVLVHCFAGTHRTGAYCAVHRMEMQGWSNEQALNEIKSMGYAHIEEEQDIFGFLSRYRAGAIELVGDGSARVRR